MERSFSMSMAPIYKRITFHQSNAWAFGFGIGKDYLSYKEGYGIIIILTFYNINIRATVWRFKDGSNYK